MTRLSSQFLKCPVTALCGTGAATTVIVGQGSFVYLSELNATPVQKIRVFAGSNIHLIKKFNDTVLVIGGKSVATLSLQNGLLRVEEGEKSLVDWLLDGVKTEDGFHFLTAHNRLLKTDAGLNVVQSCGCEEKCILYSGFLEQEVQGTCVFSGSVFSQILIWNVEAERDECSEKQDAAVLHRLSGHEGVIFSITWNRERSMICSTSDDRSARMWKVEFREDNRWDTAHIRLVYTCYGHNARVFRSCFTDSQLITVGEDSKICFWNLKSGNLERSVENAHGGAQIWTLSLVDSDTLVTGGGNGAVARWRVASPAQPEQVVCDLLNEDYPKIVHYCNNRIFILTNNGELLSVNDSSVEKRIPLPWLQSYGILVSDDNRILLASLDGTVRILTTPTCDTILESRVIQGKIFSAALFKDQFLVNGPDGQLVLFQLSEANAVEVARGTLPEAKQRWFSAARRWKDRLVLGDRTGSIHVYSAHLHLDQTFRKIHGRNGVSDLCIERETLLSCGRDGTVRRFVLDGSEVRQVSCTRTGFDWVARLLPGSSLQTVSFHGTRMIMTDVNVNRVTSSVECGGGHRSWDVCRDRVVFIKDRKIYRQDLVTEGDLNGFLGSHTQQINTVISFRLGERLFFCTGGEDTLLQIHELDQKCMEFNRKLSIRGHVSSIKCIRSISTKEGVLLVTGGGRAQLKVWKLLVLDTEFVCTELADFMLHGSDKSIKTPWRKAQSKIRLDPETRFLCLEAAEEEDESLLIYVGCSDSVLRMFRFHLQRLELVREVECQDHCILRMRSMPQALVFSTTGGSLFFLKHETSIDKDPPEIKQCSLHQSGINCLDIRHMDGFSLIATGGDDNALVLSRMTETNGEILCKEIWRENSAHAAQITAVYFAGDMLLSVSIDQRICIWEAAGAGESFKLKSVQCSNISDIQDAQLCTIQQTKLLVCVGVGMELFSL